MGEKKKTDGGKEITVLGKISTFLNSTLFGLIISVIHIAITFFLLGELLYLNILPTWVFVAICFVVLVLCAVSFLMEFAKKKTRIVGKIISIIMISLSAIGIFYLGRVNDTLDEITGSNTKVDIVNVYVMKADTADNIGDAKEYTFGIMGVLDRVNTDKTIDKIEKQIGNKIDIDEYEGYLQLVEALFEGKVNAIILNEAYIPMITDDAEYASFETVTKVLHNESHTTHIENNNTETLKDNVFTMYLSGIDVTGKISNTSRSDVNIIAVINTNTRQVLLINTPRDYYVPLAMNGIPDKLTHAGIYGIDESMSTLEDLYNTEFDYYFRVNFTGFEKVIDALGGIDVDSKYAFKTTHGGYMIQRGINTLNGKQALGFVRERYNRPNGDNDRGKNQMAVIEAVIDKATSTAILNDFTTLMEGLSNSFQTSMSSTELTSLVRMQLEEGGSWNIVNYAVSGKGASMPVYSMSSIPYVTIPDYTTVDIAKKLIKKVEDGEKISDEIIANLENATKDSSANNISGEGDER